MSRRPHVPNRRQMYTPTPPRVVRPGHRKPPVPVRQQRGRR